jgi:hypothetical protein
MGAKGVFIPLSMVASVGQQLQLKVALWLTWMGDWVVASENSIIRVSVVSTVDSSVSSMSC